MIEVVIDSVRVSLMSQHRIVVLREENGERYLPIWIGPFEADAITIQLQGIEVVRPMTHDLLRQITESLDGEITHVVISDLQNETFFAEIVLEANGESLEIDSRPSDAVALAVRVDVPIYVSEDVMERAGMQPEEELGVLGQGHDGVEEEVGETNDEDLDVFRDFIEGLDIDNLRGPAKGIRRPIAWRIDRWDPGLLTRNNTKLRRRRGRIKAVLAVFLSLANAGHYSSGNTSNRGNGWGEQVPIVLPGLETPELL